MAAKSKQAKAAKEDKTPALVEKRPAGRPSAWKSRELDREASIYALLDPEHGFVAYIGQTWRLKNRIRQYGKMGDNRKCRLVDVWVTTLLERGLKPRLVVLERTTSPEEREAYWIAKARERGVDLLNMNDGGKTVAQMHSANGSNKRGRPREGMAQALHNFTIEFGRDHPRTVMVRDAIKRARSMYGRDEAERLFRARMQARIERGREARHGKEATAAR
jgi:hypothetical protein